jgi:hypothetical protein
VGWVSDIVVLIIWWEIGLDWLVGVGWLVYIG